MILLKIHHLFFLPLGCQTAGSHMCASSDPAMAGIFLKPCCKGYVCREDPENPTGDMFCMEAEPIALGGDCRVGVIIDNHFPI